MVKCALCLGLKAAPNTIRDLKQNDMQKLRVVAFKPPHRKKPDATSDAASEDSAEEIIGSRATEQETLVSEPWA